MMSNTYFILPNNFNFKDFKFKKLGFQEITIISNLLCPPTPWDRWTLPADWNERGRRRKVNEEYSAEIHTEIRPDSRSKSQILCCTVIGEL